MPDDDLTSIQRSVLLILMAEAREVPNAHLTSFYRVELKKPYREDLEQRRWIEVKRDGRGRLSLALTDRGFRWCGEQDWSEVPRGFGNGGAAAYAVLAGLYRNLRFLGRNDVSELFTRHEEPEPDTDVEPVPVATDVAAPDEIEVRIRKSYLELAGGPGAWVTLANLRPLLGELARSDVDRVLIEMNRTPEVSIVPESNQKVLSDRDRAAAVRIGNQDKHLISIGRS